MHILPSMKLSSNTLTAVDRFISILFFSLLFFSISCSEDEVRSLLEFKKGIHRDPLGRIHDSWNFNSLDPSGCPSSFYGVSCDESGKVAAIALNNLDLEGDIKFSTLISLKMLRNLSLSGNSLTGRFVPALGQMSSLQHLDLSDNQFIGPIPARMSELWGLNYLNLSRNNFTSGFPSGLSNLQQLRVLDLHSNVFSGDVHDLLWELRNVEYVDLSNNMFFGSVSMDALNISSMVNTVQFLNLSHNKLNGEFFGADSILLFRNLKVLDLGNNQLTGKLPSFGSLPDLVILLLGNNQLFGSIPEELLQSSVPLIELDLSGNGFSDSLREINSTTLRTLNLSSNSLSGKLPSSLGSCVVVDLSKNMLEDISVIQNWEPTLKVLDLSSNQLSGIVPNLSSAFTELTTLNIRNNSIRGNLPSVFGTYPKLSSIDFSANNFDGPIPIGFFNSMTLTTLNLSKNHFTGPIPLQGSQSSELLYSSTYPPLESIDLSDNSLTGNLPAEIGSLGRLKLINLSKNQLSGVLPHELDKLSTLESLDLSTNDFTGKIPEKLSSSLKLLNMSENNFFGEVPENLKRFPANSFFPGNALLIIPDSGQSPVAGIPSPVLGRKAHKSNLSMKVISVIVASVAAAVMIAFVLTIYSRGKIKKFQGRSGFISETTTREIIIKPPTSLSFSNDHLLMSSNQADVIVNTEIIEHAAAPMSATSINPNLIDIDPLSTSPVTSSPVVLDVYSPDRLAGELFLLDNSIHFTAAELSRAPAEVLGRSSHGTLYKATLDSGHILTVKWLRVGLVKNRKEFAKEVKKIGAIRHQNIVPLRAYYWGPREQERLVVTDYIQGDSLALHLYESTPRRYSLLSLTQRVKVAVDVARCILYLHNQNIPHGNLKPTNIILVGTTYDARLTDFGLHKLMTPTGIAEQILNLGALGYRAPELASTSKPVISFKADVYAFGVILMELLTRRSAGDIISGQSGAVDLTDWVKLCDHEGRGLDCIDRDIGGENLNSDAMNDLLRISIRCVLAVNERPNIRQVFDDICSISV